MRLRKEGDTYAGNKGNKRRGSNDYLGFPMDHDETERTRQKSRESKIKKQTTNLLVSERNATTETEREVGHDWRGIKEIQR